MDGPAKVAIGVATVAALKFGVKKIPVFSAFTTASGIVMAMDEGMEKAAVEAVLKANTFEGHVPNIIRINAPGFGGKPFLEKIVKDRGGGTAWYQTGHGRMECFWIHKKEFKPNKVPGHKESIGHIVHGTNDAKY